MAKVSDQVSQNKIDIVTNVENNVTVTQPNTTVVTVLTGPAGATGPAGPTGSVDTSATSASSTASLCALSTSSYDGAFFDYTIISASNSTVGSIMSVWNGTTISYNEYATSSIGTIKETAGLELQVIISASQAQLVAITDSTAPNTWKIKTTYRSI